MNNVGSQTSGLAHWASEAFAKRCLNDLLNTNWSDLNRPLFYGVGRSEPIIIENKTTDETKQTCVQLRCAEYLHHN